MVNPITINTRLRCVGLKIPPRTLSVADQKSFDQLSLLASPEDSPQLALVARVKEFERIG
jgi:hypothetical protein